MLVRFHFRLDIRFVKPDAGPACPSAKLTVSYLPRTQIRDRGSNISSLCIYVCRLHSRGPYTSIHLTNLPFDSGINALCQPQTKHRANYLHTRNTLVINTHTHIYPSFHFVVFSLKRKEKKLRINSRKRSFKRRGKKVYIEDSEFPFF